MRLWDPTDSQIIIYQGGAVEDQPLLLGGEADVPADGEAGVPA